MLGGRKGGLPSWERTGSFTSDIITLPGSDGGAVKEDAPAKLRQFMGHAIDEQQSSMAAREGRFLWGQQSCMRPVEDRCDMSTDFTLIAAPLPVGSMATDKATKRMRMVRPICMGPPALAK
jgi:hypothetical protein